MKKMNEFEQLNSFEETNTFLYVAIKLGLISSEYDSWHVLGNYQTDIHHFLEKPYKWQSDYEFMVKWVRNKFKSDNISLIIHEEMHEEFLVDYEMWLSKGGIEI